MSATVTLQVPEALMERLRRQSQTEGRSINETAVRALVAGLEESVQDAWWTRLGPLVAAPPTRRYDPDRLRQLQKGLHLDPEDLLRELDWVRGSE
jgi:hypothetical protein